MVLPFKGLLFDTIGFQHLQVPTEDGRRSLCGDFELNYHECLEAYGLHKGYHMCQKFSEDLGECKRGTLMSARSLIMRMERNKKIITGEIPFSKRHVEPVPFDAFIGGSFTP